MVNYFERNRSWPLASVGYGAAGKVRAARTAIGPARGWRRWVLRRLDALRSLIAGDEAEIPYRLLAENSSDVITLADPLLRRLYVSPACLEVMGYTQDELVGRTPRNLLHPEDAARVMATYASLNARNHKASASWRMLRRDGSYRWMETTYNRLADGRIVSVVRDIQDRKDVERQLELALRRVERLAMHDSLTDLANRRQFVQAIGASLAANAAGALLLVDLDGFKQVNDAHGHAVGDDVLIEIAARLQRAAGAAALVARLGGDEFGILLNGSGMDPAVTIAQAVVDAVAKPVQTGRLRAGLGASVGIACFPSHGGDVGALLMRADEAMYLVKRSGGSDYLVFREGAETETLDGYIHSV